MSFDDFTRIAEVDAPRLVLLPGWGTDHRIFRPLDLPEGTLIARVPGPDGLADLLTDECGGEVTLAGWSLGGFHAARVAAQNPEAVERLVLVCVRRSYPEDDADDMIAELDRDPAACLQDFYRRCFLPAQRDDYRWFRSGLMPDYLESPDVGRLRDGLEYLREVELTHETLPPVPTTFVHGSRDAVAPVTEARDLAEDSADATFCAIEAAGHAAFLSDHFQTLLDDA